MRSPAKWHHALRLHRERPPREPDRVIHGDYHGGNVLWRDDKVSGVVDWVNASWGAPDADIGHCRFNIAADLGLAFADRFLQRYARAAQHAPSGYEPYWDVVATVGAVPDMPPLTGLQEANLEAFLLRALAAAAE